jgi:AzlC protein.
MYVPPEKDNRPIRWFREGIQGGLSIAIGYAPIALAYGFIAKATGLTLVQAVLMSVFVYAGASQYMALDMIAKQIGTVEIILTTFIVNIRHFLMSASLNEKMEKDRFWKKALYAFGLTDETFSVAAIQNGEIKTAYLFGLNGISYLSWVFFSAVGFLVGSGLPDIFREGMSIALYAMFVGLLVPSLKGSRKALYLAGMSGLLNSFFVLNGLLSAGWSIMLSTLLASVFVELLVRWREKMVERNG